MANKSTGAAGAVMPVVVLTLICVVAGTLLAFVHDMTAPIIAEAEAARAEETYRSLVTDADTFEDVACSVEGCTATLAAKRGSDTVAYVIVAQAKGYGGQVPLAIAFSPEGSVISLTAMSNEETPGLGTNALTPDYLSQYVGRSAEKVEKSDVDLVSGATITSTAVVNAYNVAVEAFEEVAS